MRRFSARLFTFVFAARWSLLFGQGLGGFSPTGAMAVPRFGHTATLLPSGKVLAAGGDSGPGSSPQFGLTASAELYDPETGVFTPTGSLINPRSGHTATLLPNGKVLIAGGNPTAELYDPSVGTFSPAGETLYFRIHHSANLLPNGKVLITGGFTGSYLAPSELYDPEAATFRATGSYLNALFKCFVCSPAVGLGTGEVLLAGLVPAQAFDPLTETFREMDGTSDFSNAALLANGRVFYSGRLTFYNGAPYLDPDGMFVNRATQLFDWERRQFLPFKSMITPRGEHSVTLLADGTVLIAGGLGEWCLMKVCTSLAYSSTEAAELFSPLTGTFEKTGDLWTARRAHTATLLNDGRVLLTGGVDQLERFSSQAELYTPAKIVPAPLVHVTSGSGQGAVLHAGTTRIVSTANPAAPGDYLEIYCAGLLDGAVVPPQIIVGGRLAEVTYFGLSGYPGVNQVNIRMPAGATSGAAVPLRMMYLGRFSNEVTISSK